MKIGPPVQSATAFDRALILERDADVIAIAPYHAARAPPASVKAEEQDEVRRKHRR